MSVEHIAVLGALASLLERVGVWPLGLILLLIIIGPWLFAVFLVWTYQKRHEAVVEMHEDVVEMYKNNVKLLEKDQCLAGDLKDVVIMNTTAMTRLVDSIHNNQYCPQVRLKKLAEGVQL
ncbi:MAG: hypothetical protein ABIJ37_03170 [Pseudomonadota bacterium]